MPASKFQDEGEFRRWYEEGWTYREMCDEYLRKYNLEVQPSMFGNKRAKLGLDKRLVSDETLMPWSVKPEHRAGYAAQNLRALARRRAGRANTPRRDQILDAFLASLASDGLVVHYDPDTPEGWFYVPPREGIDLDVIRVPDRNTRERRSHE